VKYIKVEVIVKEVVLIFANRIIILAEMFWYSLIVLLYWQKCF